MEVKLIKEQNWNSISQQNINGSQNTQKFSGRSQISGKDVQKQDQPFNHQKWLKNLECWGCHNKGHTLSMSRTEILGHVKLSGASLTFNKQAPNYDAVEPNGSNTRVCRVLRNLMAFEFDGSVDKKSCILKIDSGTDVTILNFKFVEPRCHRIPLNGPNLKYPTGENIPIKFKTVVRIDLGQNSVQMIVFVADIADDCILWCDFLSKTGITESINKIFQNSPSTIDSNADEQGCCRIIEWAEELPDLLKDVFKDNSQNLDSSQKQKFAQLLVNFQDIFEDDDVSGKCNLVEYKIELVDPRPMKQPVRPLPFHLQRLIRGLMTYKNKGLLKNLLILVVLQ